MAKQKPSGWLDKFDSTVAKTDATQVNKQLIPLNAKKVTQKELDDREVKERRDRIATANAAKSKQFKSPKDFATSTSAIADKLRLSEQPNVFDDYINPGVQFGHLASGLGQVPLNLQEGNYGQAALNTLAPVAIGTAAKLLDPIINKQLSAGKKAAKSAIDRNFTQVGKQLAQIEKEGIAKGLSPHEIKMQQMDQVGITSAQREAYVPGVSDLAYKYVRPYGYVGEGGESKLAETLKLIKKGGVKYSPAKTSEEEMYNLGMDEVPMVRRDSWRMYLGMPQQAETFNIAQTLPINHPAYTPTQLSNMEVFSIANDKAIKDLLPYSFKQDAFGMGPRNIENDLRYLTNDVVVDKSHSIMGGHNKRLTDAGLEYNDVWDLNPTVAPINILPSNLKPKFADSPLFVNKGPGGIESLKEIEIPIDKFIGKPFMSHGVLPEYTKQELSNKLLSNPDLIGTSELFQQQLNKEIGNIIKKYNIKFKDGGWLEKYNDGGPVQENYNDYSVSAPEGYVGDGTFNEGRDYSPAWGGQFQNGGELPNVTVKGKKKQPIYVTDKNDPRLRAYQDSLSLYNESKNTEAKLAKILANAYKRTGFDKSTITKALNEGKDIVLHPEKYVEKGSFGYIKKYNKKGLYYESFPGEEYLGTPESPATIKDLIKYNKEDIKERTPYLNSLDEDINGLTSRERIESAKIVNASLQKQYDIMKRTGYNPTYFIPNAERSPNLIFKKPTQPVIYQERTYQTETPELQDLAMGLPVNVSLPELQRQAGPNRITMGRPLFKGGPQTDYYTPIDEAGNVVQSNDFRTSQFQKGGVVKRFMQPTETFKNIGYNPIEKGMSTEYSTSIGGPGEVYLVPGYRQGRLLNDPEATFNMYGEHLGGPFKTVKAAEDFAQLRHKYVEQNKNLPAPFKTRDYAMGGSIPGAVGFTYARTQSPAPSNGKYAKKTMASAQDGTRIKTNVPVSIDELKKANASAEAFNKQYVQSPNYISLLQKQGYAPEEIKRRQDEVLGMTNDDYTYTNFGPNYVYGDDSGKTKINYNQGGLGDWANFGDIAAHEWGHVGVTRFGEDALKPAEQHMLISRLNMKNVSGDEEAAEHDMAPQENRADLVELRKALQDRGIYDSFKGGKFKQKHLNQLRNYKGDKEEYWNRSMRLYKDKDIVKLMNTIAANNPQQGLPIAQNGMEMRYYQNGLDFEPKGMGKNGKKVIKDDRGQWAHPGEITKIGSNQITMQGVPYPVLGISDTGDTQMMYPNEEYEYDGESVTEYPMMKEGGALQLIKLDQLTNFTNYNTKQPGGWLDKYQ